MSNGIVTYTRIMRDALRAQGHEVIVVTTDDIEHADGSVASIVKPGRLSTKLRLWAEARHRADGSEPWVRLHVFHALEATLKLQPDVIEMEESHGWAGRIADRSTAVVERLHGPHVFGREETESNSEGSPGQLRENAELWSLTKVQAVTCPSARLLKAMVDRYRLNLALARTIPNPMPVIPAKDAWDIGRADPNQVLCVGRFDLRKGADIVIRAFARACEQRPDLTLVMVGPDTGLTRRSGNPVHFDEFVATKISPKVRSRIRFLGPQPQSRLLELRRESALAIVASRFENFAYSVAEALALGMPVLASDSFGNSELVRDGLDGRIVPVGDIVATADALLEMTSDLARLSEMGRSAYLRASEFVSPDRIARESVGVYRQAIARMKAV